MATPSSSTPHRDDSGAGAVEMAIVMPVILTLTMLGVQMAVVAHAQNVAEAAAQEGAAVARAVNGNAPAGQARADARLREYGASMFTTYRAHASRSAEEATVTVEGDVQSLLPFADFHVSETSTGPVERFVEEEG